MAEGEEKAEDVGTAGPPAPPKTEGCPDCGHEKMMGRIAATCAVGFILIVLYCCIKAPADWAPINSGLAFLNTIVSGYMGAQYALATRRTPSS